MEITQIPFAKHIGIKKVDETMLMLEPTPNVQNHIQSIHASAQFALAETQSGLCLQNTFPKLEGKVMALLRSSTVKYKSPATMTLYAYAHIDELDKEKFELLLEKKGRAIISIDVELKDSDDSVTMIGTFIWFAQKIKN